jgi:hypothetical protein
MRIDVAVRRDVEGRRVDEGVRIGQWYTRLRALRCYLIAPRVAPAHLGWALVGALARLPAIRPTCS